MKVIIVNIGDELLIGQTVNTNASWMGTQLNLMGATITQSICIQDSEEAILDTLTTSEATADVVLITGGLGPTKDDITKHTLCKYFDTELILNQEVLDLITEYFESRGRAMLDVNKDQALLPANCETLVNHIGTASGMWFEKNETIFVSMPGVPYEMKYLMEQYVLPKLASRNNSKCFHRTIKTFGIGESYLAEIIKDWEDRLREDKIELAYLPSLGQVKLRILKRGSNLESLESEVNRYAEELYHLIPQYIYGENEDLLPEVVGKILNSRNLKLSVCESCSGGYLSHLITSIAGSSNYFNGGIVTYTNEMKNQELGVPNHLFKEVGAVSQEVVEAMVKGGIKKFETDYSIGISGIAGPTGATETKPIGMVCIAVGNSEKVISKTFEFGFTSRKNNIHKSAMYALEMLRKMLLSID